MDITLSESEKRGDRTGKVVATIGGLLIVALLLWPIFFSVNPPPGQPGILVNLGIVNLGEGDDNAPAPTETEPQPDPEPVVTPPVTETPPPPPAATPKPQPEQREVIVTEDPAVVALRKQKAREEAERKAAERREREERAAEQRRQQEIEAQRRREAEAAERQRQEEIAAERKRQAEADALKGQLGGSFGTGSGNGNTGRPGNQGVDNGDPNADRLSGISTGSGRVSGGLSGRGVRSSPPVRENSQVSGTVVIEVCVNPRGEITRADYTQNGSSTADPTLVAAARKNALQWRFDANELAPAEQCGRIHYNFKVQ